MTEKPFGKFIKRYDGLYTREENKVYLELSYNAFKKLLKELEKAEKWSLFKEIGFEKATPDEIFEIFKHFREIVIKQAKHLKAVKDFLWKNRYIDTEVVTDIYKLLGYDLKIVYDEDGNHFELEKILEAEP